MGGPPDGPCQSSKGVSQIQPAHIASSSSAPIDTPAQRRMRSNGGITQPRGSQRLTLDGITLTGPVDICGRPLDNREWAAGAGATWSGATRLDITWG